MGAPNLATGLNPFQPICCAADRKGNLYVVNGLNRGYRWDGITSSAEALGITAPATGLSASPSGSGSFTGDYIHAYRYIDDTLPTPVASAISVIASSTASSDAQFDLTSIDDSPEARVTGKEIYRSLAGAPQTLFYVATIGPTTTIYTDNTSDATLATRTALPILLPNGDVNARRQVPPPNYTPFILSHGDRMWYFGRVRYNQGTVATNGTTTVTGTGTAWTSDMAGRYITISGEAAPILISSASATSITLATAAANTASGLSYEIVPSPETRNQILYSEVDEAESVPTQNSITLQDNSGDDGGEITGGIPFGSRVLILKERQIHGIQYVKQPIIDANVTVVSNRGCINNRCWIQVDSQIFLMDQMGIYRLGGGPISEAIQDIFRDGTIDWANSKWFHAVADQPRGLLFFYVGFTADSSTRSKRALVYNLMTETWSIDKHIWEVGGSCIGNIAGRSRVLLGAENDLILVSGEGTSDMVAAVRGPVVSATASTLVDSANTPFTTAMVDAPIAIVEGTGKGQIRRISARDSSSQVTISSNWTTTPDTTSRYLVGAIEWQHKSGLLEVPRNEGHNKRSLRLVYEPTNSEAIIDAESYRNHDSTAVANKITASDRGVGVGTNAGDSKTELNIYRSRPSDGQDTGFKEWGFSGTFDDRGQMARWIGIRLSGYQGADQIRIYQMEVDGVT